MSSSNEPCDVVGTAKIIGYIDEPPKAQPSSSSSEAAAPTSAPTPENIEAPSLATGSSTKSLNGGMASLKLSSSAKAGLFTAGTTMFKLMGGDFDEDTLIANSWSSCNAETFSLRIGPNYNRNKQKGPSPTSFYEVAGVE